MRCCVAAKRGRDDQTERKYSIRQGDSTIAAWLVCRLTGSGNPASRVELIEEPGRAIPGQSLKPMRLAPARRSRHLPISTARGPRPWRPP